MHKVHSTEGLVLSKRSVGESNTLVVLLTRELGLVRAQARSARKEVSKLRFGLEPLTSARFSLVKGRYEWKLVGIEQISHALTHTNVQRRGQLGRIARLLLRLIHGEEPVPELFDTLRSGLGFLAEAEPGPAENIECVLVVRIMAHLGYLPHLPTVEGLLQGDIAAHDTLEKAKQSRTLLIRTINESLLATGL